MTRGVLLAGMGQQQIALGDNADQSFRPAVVGLAHQKRSDVVLDELADRVPHRLFRTDRVDGTTFYQEDVLKDHCAAPSKDNATRVGVGFSTTCQDIK